VNKPTERKAWERLAKQWQRAADAGRSTIQVNFILRLGICDAIRGLWLYYPLDTALNMWQRMTSHAPYSAGSGYWWPTTPNSAKRRAAFCRHMARLAAKGETRRGGGR
jgi:hypothetical protein